MCIAESINATSSQFVHEQINEKTGDILYSSFPHTSSKHLSIIPERLGINLKKNISTYWEAYNLAGG